MGSTKLEIKTKLLEAIGVMRYAAEELGYQNGNQMNLHLSKLLKEEVLNSTILLNGDTR